jgi:hypothetical protein
MTKERQEEYKQLKAETIKDQDWIKYKEEMQIKDIEQANKIDLIVLSNLVYNARRNIDESKKGLKIVGWERLQDVINLELISLPIWEQVLSARLKKEVR